MGRKKIEDVDEKSEAYNTGVEARLRGEQLSSNPYPAVIWGGDNWEAGWIAADDRL